MHLLTRIGLLLIFALQLHIAQAQSATIPVVTWEQVMEEVEAHPEKIYVLNFWATWCRPCIQELPDFEAFNAEYKEQGVEVLLLSMDEKAYIHTALEPFVEERDLKSTVYLLDVEDYNVWIPSVSSQWGGEIPATLIIYLEKGKQKFKAGKYTKEELVNTINQLKS